MSVYQQPNCSSRRSCSRCVQEIVAQAVLGEADRCLADAPLHLQEIFPALGTDWQAVGKKRRDALPAAGPSTSNTTSWAKAAAPQSKPPSSPPLAPSDPPVAQPPRPPLADTASASTGNGNGVQEQHELQADPNALATGAFDAPTKAKKRPQAREPNEGAAANGHTPEPPAYNADAGAKSKAENSVGMF